MADDDLEIRYRDEVVPDSLSRDEKEVIDTYNSVSPECQRIAHRTLKEAYDIECEKKDGSDSTSLAG